ncbi:MAG: hypothetical protein J5698_00025 [Bacteroidaceae bacterium]|nr:hypothetical protein [Bacteroidaceae bacterium]
MTQTTTAREMLAQIEKDYFRGVDLAGACLLKGDERRAFRLAQVERLLTSRHGSEPKAVWLSDMFWTADEGRVRMNPDSLLSLSWQQTLTNEEKSRLRLILEVAALCHDLSFHFLFNLKEAFGMKDNFWVSNKRLVEWLSTTEYERIAMHTAFIMKKHAIVVYERLHYMPAQDELAELYSTEYHGLVKQPNNTKMPPRDYVRTILDALLAIERHWQRGRRLKLSPELVMLHDEIYGVVPRRFDKGVLEAAQTLYDYMDTQLQGRLVLKEYNADASSWDEQPEPLRRTWGEVMHRFADKVREVRDQYLAEGWVTDDSLAFSYLMAHAERCGQGLWRKEDNAR